MGSARPPLAPETRRALAIVEQVKPLLIGQGPAAQGAALAELVSLWLAGHAPELREYLLQQHVEIVRELTTINARILRGGE